METVNITDSVSVPSLSEFFRKYGLALVMVASYFGSGSVFIASAAGVRYGYTLLWAVVGAVLLGFVAQDMSARLGIHGDSLAGFARTKLGSRAATALMVLLSVGCVAWTLELTAAVGKGIVVLLNLQGIGWEPFAYLTGLLALVVGVLGYDAVEKIMVAMMFGLLIAYIVVAGASGPDLVATATGFVPSLGPTGSMALAVSILGTTALWPNFFLESQLVDKKGWTERADVPTMRRDLSIGYAIGGITTIAIVVVAAAVLRPAGYEQLRSFLTPGRALASVLGEWAMVVFLVGTLAAAFNSIVPIMWAPAYMIPEAIGGEVADSNRVFKLVYVGGVALGSLSPLVHQYFGLSVIDMIILFPAYNGVVGLPVTAVLLFWAVNDTDVMGEYTNGWKLNAVNSALILLAVYSAWSAGRFVINAILTGGF
ncbi:Nramp family divalent metal transporter [Halorientalis regularis]|jgi:manganese transport protein|uniref:Mn2+ and Fe2+ transporters of the NRAMP family n=1 Tax=Halorientalis regularis TaxID=660518 RepID=A0A1G7PBR5_9EURY|nr:Nramp family divalent metal transporter [Halorientalis regularis]SDF83684.1 Mn2+ and Fe2+ transporters of the NRAMP family [Halorientalis regularis]